MRTLLPAFACLTFSLALSSAAFAAKITDAPTLGLAKSQTFKATSEGGTIKWAVDQITKSESDGSGESTKRNLYTATGSSATFNLVKVNGKQTIYRIHVVDNGGEDVQDVQVFPANKISSFTFASAGNPLTRVYLVVPDKLSPASKILFGMHDAGRNGSVMCSTWDSWTVANKVLLLCPQFTNKDWPESNGYNQGRVFTDERQTQLNPESKWSYTVVEQVHAYARKGFNIDDKYFDMWGHSAGGQFVQRFQFFKPDSKLRLAMSGNPGWYMLPSLITDFPCGARHPKLSFTSRDMMDYSQRNALLFAGTKDTDPRAPETGGCMDAQGKGRYARAGFFFATMQALNPDTTWKKIDVIGVDHDASRMAKAAQNYLDERARQGQPLN